MIQTTWDQDIEMQCASNEGGIRTYNMVNILITILMLKRQYFILVLKVLHLMCFLGLFVPLMLLLTAVKQYISQMQDTLASV